MTLCRLLSLFVFIFLAGCSGTTSHFSSFSFLNNKNQKTIKSGSTFSAAKGHQQIALLLPLEGKLQSKGEMVRDGFLASYYQAPGTATVNVIDTAKVKVNKAYDTVEEQGANFVVGPLDKTDVKKLANRRLNVSTLALNYTAGSLSPQMVQFGFSPVEAAKQVAQRAWREGHHKVLIVTPADKWNQDIRNTFMNEWHTFGGTVVSTLVISQKKSIIDQLQGLVATTGEDKKLKTPNFDVILLSASPAQARSVASMFRFYGLGNIPIYATSSVYSGMPSSEDKDLEGVRFCDIPWVIHPTAEMVHATQQLRTLHPEATFDVRLYALGVDAYRLIYQLPRLSASSTASYQGVTGLLSIQNQRIQRVLSCGQFVNGQIIPLS